MTSKNIDVFLRNNTGNREKRALIDGFVIRTNSFEQIFKEIKSISAFKNNGNFLVIGQRGFGKTTLLYRLKYAIEDDDSLKRHILPIMFSEEQYNLTELENFWEGIAEYLEDNHQWKGIREEILGLSSQTPYENLALKVLEKWLSETKKSLIVFLENIDVFFKKIGIEGQKRLHHALTSNNNIKIVSSATSFFDNITDKAKPFYEFFKLIELNSLTQQECIALLLKIGEQYGEKEKITAIINKSPKRIESLRRLTGGVPRTISYLFQIFLDNENGKAIKDLYQLIDTLTFLYKAELDQLSVQQQKVIDVIARNWDAIAVKDIALRTRYESKQVSAILSVLEKNQIIESIATETKNNLYRIKERFLNVWYLMRFGRKHDKENIIWLVRFYDTWCDQTELAQHIATHIKNLSDGEYDFGAAVDMGNTFLACENVPADLKYTLYKKTKAFLPKNMIKDLRYSDQLLYDRINSAVKDKQFDQAIELLNEIETKDIKYYAFEAWVYMRQNDYSRCEIATEKLFELKPDGKVALRIANLNDVYLGNVTKAIKFYEIALDKKEFQAAAMLGNIYCGKKDFDKAIKYHKLAVASGVKQSIMALASIYFNLKDYENAEKQCEQAIKENIDTALINLGLIYQKQNRFSQAIEMYNKALEKGKYEALINLGTINIIKPRPAIKRAKEYFEQAVEKGIDAGYYYLGKLFLEELENENQALTLLNKALEKNDADAAHLLAHYYQHSGDYTKSDHLFSESLRLGRKPALFCWTGALFSEKRIGKKKFALELLENNKSIVEENDVPGRLEYAFVLLWNDKLEESISELTNSFKRISEVFASEDEEAMRKIISGLTFFIMLLIAKRHYDIAYSLFQHEEGIDLKQILKPVYYALMNFMKDVFPKEYLKAGTEMKDTVNEIIKNIETYRTSL